MRAKVSLKGRGLIPFNYNLALAWAVYGPIKRVNSDLASKIHASTDYKYFTFSLIQIPERRISPEGIYVENGCYFLMSSPREEVVQCFVEGILENPAVRIGAVRFDVESVEILSSPEFNGRCVFSTVSPKKNLMKKYKKLYREEKEDISFSKPFSTKMMRIQIKDTFHRASLMVFEARGDSDLLRPGYEAGFGEKNSMGFGMVKVPRHNLKGGGVDV